MFTKVANQYHPDKLFDLKDSLIHLITIIINTNHISLGSNTFPSAKKIQKTLYFQPLRFCISISLH